MELSTFENVVIRYAPVWREVCQVLTHRDLKLLSLVSRSLRRHVKPSLRKVQSVDDKLEEFVKDPLSFRLMLRDTGGVVAGEFARAFFDGHECPDSFDIVVVDPRFYRRVKMTRWIRYLRGREGYKSCTMKSPFFQRGAQVWILINLVESV